MSSNDPIRPAGMARRVELQATGLSIAAGIVHALLSPVHLEEWWGYGLFFFFAAALQIIYGVVLGGGVFNAETWKGDWLAAKRNFLVLGIVGNACVIALYVVSRTVGIPFFGPEAGEVEPVGVIDLVSKLTEVALIVWLVRLLRATPTRGTQSA